MLFDIDSLIGQLGRELEPKRFYHTLGTAHAAIILAMRYGAPADKAFLAALLHDCGRYLSREDQWRMIQEWHVSMPADARDYPQIWHTWLAVEAARRHYGLNLNDPEIEQALTYHATGKPAMGVLGEVVFVADCIEPMRDYPVADRLRAVARQDLRETVRQCLEMKINHVLAKGHRVHPDAAAALEYYSAGQCKNTLDARQ